MVQYSVTATGTATPGMSPASMPAPGNMPGMPAAPGTTRKAAYLRHGVGDEVYVDYRAVDDLRRLMTPNGKIYSRKRLSISAREQRMISQAIKRARHMALLPYTNATL